jgi:hypothetical protein
VAVMVLSQSWHIRSQSAYTPPLPDTLPLATCQYPSLVACSQPTCDPVVI